MARNKNKRLHSLLLCCTVAVVRHNNWNINVSRVRIAIQKSGRMSKDSLSLLERCGLGLTQSTDRLLLRIRELPIDILLIRDDDIPRFVAEGICDLGIVGENVFNESQIGQNLANATAVERLGFSSCRLSIAIPENSKIDTIKDLTGLRVATSYPNLLGKALANEGIKAQIITMNGSVEVAPRLKIADAICDIVASGATLASNNLRELIPIFQSEALLIKSRRLLCAEKEATIERLLNRIRGALQAQGSKYIMLHTSKKDLSQIVKLLPGAESPTILPLQETSNRLAVHAVCREAVFWETMEKLQAAGASSILVMPIEKMMG